MIFPKKPTSSDFFSNQSHSHLSLINTVHHQQPHVPVRRPGLAIPYLSEHKNKLSNPNPKPGDRQSLAQWFAEALS